MQCGELPESICNFCIEEVSNAYKFSQQYIINGNKLKSQLNIVQFKENVDLENEIKYKPSRALIYNLHSYSKLETTMDLKNSDVITESLQKIKNEVESASTLNENVEKLESEDNQNSSLVMMSDTENCDDINSQDKGDANDEILFIYTETSENDLKCVICDLTFDNEEELLKHVQVDCVKPKSYECIVCDESFLNLNDLEIHVQTHNESKIKDEYPCPHCSLSRLNYYIVLFRF